MICRNCGAEISDNAIFCGTCGCPVERQKSSKKESEFFNKTLQGEKITDNYEIKANNKSSSSRTALYIIIIILIVSLAATVAFALWVIWGKKEDNGVADIVTQTQSSQSAAPTVQVSTPAPAATAAPTPVPVERTVLYSPGYTYKRMDDIHNSVSSSDEDFLEVSDVLRDFNVLCEDYMNYGDDGIFIYLKPGTTAYNQQVEYKTNHPTISERYLNVETVDVRKSSSYYYAWTHEEIEVTENGTTKIERSNWVYKLQKSGSGYTIVDYTADPAYK